MQSPGDLALKVAELLLEINAVKIKADAPYTWASGWRSPIYCDNRLTLSYPKVRQYICEAFTERIKYSFDAPDLIVGVATGGIAHGALVADRLDLPFAYVRSASKGHGLQNRVEGRATEGQKAVVIEDLVSTGGSSLSAVDALRQQGVDVVGMAAIFTYGFDRATQSFAEADCPLITLTDYAYLLEVAVNKNLVRRDDLASLAAWRKSPDTWGQQFP